MDQFGQASSCETVLSEKEGTCERATTTVAKDVFSHSSTALSDSSTATNLLGGDKPMSKNQLKRLRKQEKWLEIKGEKRKKEKEKKKRKRAEARERGESLGPTRKALKDNSMTNSSCKVRVAIDCSFDKYMNDKDTMKLVKQIQHCYSTNRRSANPLQFYLCCSDGKTKERLDRIGDYKNWDINFREDPYWSVFEGSETVYLTSDSPNVLTELDPEKAYIIGGLVDHNHEKGLCYDLAVERKVGHAQLPIGDYIKLNSRKVLTVNHVFEILLRYTETNNWESAFFQVIPMRKTVTGACGQSQRTSEPEISDVDRECESENHVNTEAREEPDTDNQISPSGAGSS